VAAVGVGALLAAAGCGGFGVGEPPARAPETAPYEVRRPVLPAADRDDRGGDPEAPARAEVSWDTERDGRFARFLQEKSGGMIRKAAVGIENRGTLRVEISRAVEPEDTLTLTRSLMAGARNDFPDRPITLSLYDPQGKPILKARYRPGHGVSYQIAHQPGGDRRPDEAPGNAGKADDAIARGGVTERDQKFAAWAEDHGRPLLRYVEADLDRHGRLWFGITRDVKPADVRPLTQSLLQGARKEFPDRELVATVFDPDGQRIGRARLGRDGEVRWEQ
jgi:hypothetical protein